MALRFALALILVASVCGSATANDAPIIPWPKSITLADGAMKITPASRITFVDPALAPLAKVLADELYVSTAVRIGVASGPAAAGDIALEIDAKLSGERYTVDVADKAVIRAGNYRAVAWGTATLLQSIAPAEAGQLLLPRMRVDDEPLAGYRGLMIDVARKWHPVEDLRPLVEMCRFYKINYLQLHLNDMESFTFPSKAFPQLASSYKGQRRSYTWDELTALVRFADERGVTLVPEIEGPGHHSGALRNIWGRKGTHCLDMANEKTYDGLDQLFAEICAIFASSPYIHIGADECDLTGVGKSDEEAAFMAAHGITSREGLYNYYIARADGIVRKHGRQTLCWEGFHGGGGGGVQIPKDIVVMPFESTYNPANNLVSHGYSVINTAWKPLYVVGAHKWPAQYLYENWNLWLWEHHVNTRTHIQLKRTAPVLGAQMCAWEQPSAVELPTTRERIHAMSERIWNPDASQTYQHFAARSEKKDAQLSRLLALVQIDAAGVTGAERHGYQFFTSPITVRLSAVPVGTIHYTIDGADPTAQSPAYTAPITLSKQQTHFEKLFFNTRTKRYDDSGDVIELKARIIDSAGHPVGDVISIARYWHQSQPPATAPASSGTGG